MAEASAISKRFTQVRERHRARDRAARRLRRLRCDRSRLGGQRPDLRLLRHLAAHHQHRHDHRHLPHGVPDPEHPEPRRRGDPGEARRADPASSAAQNAFIGIEHLTEEELEEIRRRCEEEAKETGEEPSLADKARATREVAGKRAKAAGRAPACRRTSGVTAGPAHAPRCARIRRPASQNRHRRCRLSRTSGNHPVPDRLDASNMTVHVSPDAHPALVLNADYRPLSYYPLSLWSWQDAIKAVFLERVNIVSEYELKVHSPSFEMKLPSVVSLKTYIKPSRHPAFTRFNVFLRDRFRCQYCGARRRPDLRPSRARARAAGTRRGATSSRPARPAT